MEGASTGRFAGVRSVSIDLDGTLLDTCEDLALACNRTLAHFGFAQRTSDDVRRFIGLDVADLLSRCTDGQASRGGKAETVRVFASHYAQCNGLFSTLYPGVEAGLGLLKETGLTLSCVTNKPGAFARPLLERSGLIAYFDNVISGDTLERMKPHPDPLLHACRLAGSTVAKHVHVGDSRHDIAAARAAGCRVFCVPYGYNEGEAIRPGECDAIVADLLTLARQLVVSAASA